MSKITIDKNGISCDCGEKITSEQLYRTLTANLPEAAVFMVDPQMRYVLAEGQALEKAGMRSEDLEGKTIHAALEPDLARQHEAQYRRALGGETFHFEHAAHNRHYMTHLMPLKSGGGHICAALAVSYDITQSIKQFRVLFENNLDAVILSGLDGGIIAANPAACAMWGLSEADFRGLACTGVMDAEDPRFVEAQKALRQAGSIRGIELTAKHKSGKRFPIEVDSVVVPGEPGRTFMIVRDISERKQAEDALRESEERYRNIFDNNHAVLLLIDPEDGSILDANPAACAYYGYERQQMTGLNIADLTSMRPDALRSAMRSATSMQRNHFVFKHRLAGGDIRDVEVYSGPVAVKGRKLLYSIVHDITERVEAEQALRASNERLAAALEGGSMGMWELDVATNESIWSDMEYEVLGLPVGSGTEPAARFFERVLPEDLDRLQDALKEGMRHGRNIYEEVRITRADDGRICWIACAGRLYRDAAGNPSRMIGVNFDVTSRKQAEDELHQSRERLRLLNEHLELKVAERTAVSEERTLQLQQLALELSNAEDKERMRMAMMLHDDLQQHLGALRFNLFSLLPEDSITGETKEKRLQFEALIDQAIQKTRSLSHELCPPVLHQSGFLAALSWLVKDVQEKYGQQVTLKSTPEGEPASSAIGSILFRSVRELLYNSLKHSGTKSAFLEVSGEGDHITVTIEDHGVGCDVEAVKSRSADSPGFGLFTIEERIRFLGGSFEIRSAPGKGCRVTLHVPK